MTSLSEIAGRAAVPAILDEATEGEIQAIPENEPELVAFGDRLLRELADCRGEREANDAALKVEVQRLKDQYEELDLPLQRREVRLMDYLEQVAHALPMRGKKSRNLAFGTVGWRSVKARLEIQDERALMDWLDTLPAGIGASIKRVKTVESVNKDALDKHADKTNEVPVGCVRTLAEERFYATPSGK
jgi:phage host-nuclease inhibitor protein Gam